MVITVSLVPRTVSGPKELLNQCLWMNERRESGWWCHGFLAFHHWICPCYFKTVKQKECHSSDFGPLHAFFPPQHHHIDQLTLHVFWFRMVFLWFFLRSVNKKKNEWQHNLIISPKWLDCVQISRSLPWIGFAFEGSVWKSFSFNLSI